MRAAPIVAVSASPPSTAKIEDPAELAELMTELAKAGLISAETGDDGAAWYALTPAGAKVAQQMAMRRDPHALVLGALAIMSERLD